jgi:hypothetical protein
MKTPSLRLAGIALLCLVVVNAGKAQPVEADQVLPSEKVRIYYEMREALDPKLKGTNLFRQLQETYGIKPTYTAREVVIIAEPKAFHQKNLITHPPITPRRSGAGPAGTFSRVRVLTSLAVLAERDRLQGKDDAKRVAALDAKYGEHDWYEASEIRDVEKNGTKPLEILVPTETDPSPPKGWQVVDRGLRQTRVRADWTDLFAADDGSQSDTKMPAKTDDLVGAKFGYARDNVKRSDATSVVGALIVPFTWRNALGASNTSTPVVVSVAPSVSINKVSTTGDAKTEVDYIYGRVGFYGKWIFDGRSTSGALLARAAYVHATDTNGRGHLDAGEFDLEAYYGRKDGSSPLATLGYKSILVPKRPVLEEETDNSLVELQLRAWLHGEFGDVQRNSTKWEAVTGDFFRLGPTVQAQLNFPEAWRGLSFTAKYTYLRPFSGPDYHNNYLKLNTTLTLSETKALGQKVSLTFEYIKGSLIFTKQYVETTTAGLSVVY